MKPETRPLDRVNPEPGLITMDQRLGEPNLFYFFIFFN
jgi:hypothetical protein